MAMSCRCPCEKLVPPAETFVSNEIEGFLSISVTAVEGDWLMVSSCSLRMEGGREAAREEAALGTLDLRELKSLSVIMCTRRRASLHSASLCSP